ncbi:hypothetical protein RJ640_019353 [Escallonia rubra]|uniref:Transcription factor IIIB 90 kDa subunit n=1 Tax=Escallonia rubra TaxID=112253 RepID=A0AA88RPJ3_9ASTE|nr:hypothetical protein RJ640_019353 [Escallonia rubra]
MAFRIRGALVAMDTSILYRLVTPNTVQGWSGASQRSGNYVRSVESSYSVSRERILREAQDSMHFMLLSLAMNNPDAIVRPAIKFYTLRGTLVEAVEESLLRLRVFTLHVVQRITIAFRGVCLDQNVRKFWDLSGSGDPAFVVMGLAGLVPKDCKAVGRTALRIIASMKRDWMQTGRKPSGLCGAALYISALSHGHKYSKSDVVRIVHICEATLTKRLIEFENTKSGGLTFIEFSGGLEGGSEPPAFQRAEQERKEVESSERNAKDSSLVDMAAKKQHTSKHFNLEEELDNPERDRNEKLQATEPCSKEDATMNVAFNDDTLDGVDGTRTRECGESESFSDIDDVEVDGYIHNEEEKHYKKIIWEEMNREYVEEQAAKEAAAAAAKEAYEANFRNCPEDMEAARDFAAAAAAAAMKLKKERQQKRAADARNLAPAQTAVEATRQMLDKKRLSSKINYDVLDKLFDESQVAPENPKKSRTDSSVLLDGKVGLESEDKPKDEKLGSDDEFEDAGDIAGGYAGEVYDENVEEGYEYGEDYGFDGY